MTNYVRGSVFLFAAACSVFGQTNAWLRTGGPDSLRFITNASGNKPMVLTVPNHGFRDGDAVWVSYLNGNREANGVRRVRNVSGDSFTITDLDGKDIDVKGHAVDIFAAKRPSIKGYVGKVQQFQLAENWGLLLDGPDGPLTAQIKDPDGKGGRKAPKAISGWAPYEGMKRRLAPFVENPQKFFKSDAVQSGAIILSAALDWFMDNHQTKSLEAAKYWINNVEKFLASPTFTACNQDVRHCGRGSFPDWMSFYSANVAYAYSLIRTELSPAERQAFAAKMLNDIGDGCKNTLKQGTGTISLTAGSKTVTGNGTQFLKEYANLEDGTRRWISIRTVNAAGGVASLWGEVVSVESDTSLTLATVLSRADSYSDTAHWYTDAWQPDSCGVTWYVSNHSGAPNLLAHRYPARLAAPSSENDTTITVDAPNQFPSAAPFYINVRGNKMEVMLVTEVNGNTFKVTRGAFGSIPAKYGRNTLVTETPYPAYGGADTTTNAFFVPMDTPQGNLVFCKIYGYLTLAMALANDDQRALHLLEQAWAYYYDFQYPQAKSMWTGITQGATSYGSARYSDWTYRIALMMKNTFRPSIDITDGTWLKTQMIYPLYFTLPYNSTYVLRYSDSGPQEEAPARWFKHVLMGQSLYPGSAEAAASNFWYRSMAHFYDASRWADSDSQNSAPYAVIYTSEKDKSSDYRNTMPPYYFFTDHDFDPKWNPPGAAYSALISKQSWNEDATMLWVSSISKPTDHLGSYAGPGSYKIIKGQYLIGENGQGSQGGSGPYLHNGVQVGTTNPYKLEGDDHVVLLDRRFGNDKYVYTRVNSLGAYRPTTQLKKIYRHIVHLKSSPHDYVLVYDDVLTGGQQPKLARVHYYADNNEKPSFENNAGQITFKRERSMISTKILLPERSDAIKVDTKNPSAKETIYAVSLDDGPTEHSEFLVVHRPSAGTNDTMPPVSVIDVGPQWRAVLISEEVPKVVLFPKDGNQQISQLNFTLPSGIANADVLITGLSAGLYASTAGGAQVAGDKSVGQHGTLYFTGSSGAISIQRTGSAALEIPSGNLPTIALAQPYFFRLQADGGVGPYQWSVASGELPEGITLSNDGLLTGNPSRGGNFSLTFRVQDSEGTVKEVPYDLLVSEIKAPLEISGASLPGAMVNTEFRYSFAAIGGNGSYTWSVNGSLPSGLSLSNDGILSGTPSSVGSFPATIQVADSAGATSSQDVVVEVTDSSSLQIQTTDLPSISPESSYSFDFSAVGGVAPYVWSISSGSLPEGLTLEADGKLAGTSLAGGGSFSIVVRLTDAANNFVEKSFTLMVSS